MNNKLVTVPNSLIPDIVLTGGRFKSYLSPLELLEDKVFAAQNQSACLILELMGDRK